MGHWRHRHTVTLLGIVALIIVVISWLTTVSEDDLSDSRFWAWIVIVGLLTAFMAVAGFAVVGRWTGLLIDSRNKMSLSRLQLILWTALLLSAILVTVASNLTVGQDGWRTALDLEVPTELWLLMGISTASLAGSTLIKSDMRAADRLALREEPAMAQSSDLFQGDATGNAGHLDLGKVQMFFFTLILVLTYGIALGKMFLSTTPDLTFPAMDESMVALLGISHAGYLSIKAIPRPNGSEQPAPTE